MTAPNVRYIAHAIADPAATLSWLMAQVQWNDSMRARRTASFGHPYNYSGQSYPAAPMPDVVRAVADRAAELAGHPFNNCLCNAYETGDNTMGFHTDSYAELVPDSSIAIASLGATRRLVFRSKDHRERVNFLLESGSILLMDRETQLAWEHAVPRSAESGLRVSLTFRRFAD